MDQIYRSLIEDQHMGALNFTIWTVLAQEPIESRGDVHLKSQSVSLMFDKIRQLNHEENPKCCKWGVTLISKEFHTYISKA